MIDAVDSGGYGTLGLYAAQAPAVPDPTPPPRVTSPDAEPVRASQAAPPIQGQGSGPLPGAQSGADGSATSGREFGDSGFAQSRQTAVLTSLAGAVSTAAATGAAPPDGTAAGNAAASARTLRAYDRAGASTSATVAPGAMFTARA
ncbi:hypothetical protein [Solidesulfovibrio magneticus]|uniref:hypothetical protein n=1 Tax=Solidesulfovibrio magneticus TaxID=184917 RepID=UPI0005B7DFEB|nr:hypothetical protein [Solidesulfovibrio magneticus]